jgi:hypothetical protein
VGDEAHARLAAASSRSLGTRDSTESLAAMAGVQDPARPPLLPALAFDDPEEVNLWDRELVVADPRWRDRFKALRECVLVEVIRRGVVVESCPTSNMVVANLSTAPIHALLKLSDDRGLKVVLATDDPGIFGRFPADELEFLDLGEDQSARLLAANRDACWVRPA